MIFKLKLFAGEDEVDFFAYVTASSEDEAHTLWAQYADSCPPGVTEKNMRIVEITQTTEEEMNETLWDGDDPNPYVYVLPLEN